MRPIAPNAGTVNLTNWVSNNTGNSLADTINTYNGFVLRRLSGGKGVVVTLMEGMRF